MYSLPIANKILVKTLGVGGPKTHLEDDAYSIRQCQMFCEPPGCRNDNPVLDFNFRVVADIRPARNGLNLSVWKLLLYSCSVHSSPSSCFSPPAVFPL